MRLALVLMVCLMLTGSVGTPAPSPTFCVWWPERCHDGWSVVFEVYGVESVAVLADRESALRLYAVLAAVMVGGGE